MAKHSQSPGLCVVYLQFILYYFALLILWKPFLSHVVLWYLRDIICHVLKWWFNSIFKGLVKSLCSLLQLAGKDKKIYIYTLGFFGGPFFSMLLR